MCAYFRDNEGITRYFQRSRHTALQHFIFKTTSMIFLVRHDQKRTNIGNGCSEDVNSCRTCSIQGCPVNGRSNSCIASRWAAGLNDREQLFYWDFPWYSAHMLFSGLLFQQPTTRTFVSHVI